MYLYPEVICLYRYLCGNRCICTGLIFAVADAFFETDVSVTYFSLNLQILLSLLIMYNFIYILHFLGFKDTPFANFASSIPQNPLSQISSPISFVAIHFIQLDNCCFFRSNYHSNTFFTSTFFTSSTFSSTLTGTSLSSFRRIKIQSCSLSASGVFTFNV